MAILDDGRADLRDNNYKQSEEYRHRCEVRWCLTQLADRGSHAKEWFRAWLELVEKARGVSAKDLLYRDAREQWKRGNRGERDDWR